MERNLRESKNREAHRHAELRYQRIVETTNEGVWTIDRDGNTTFMNALLRKVREVLDAR